MADCSCNSHGSFLTAKGLAEAAQRFSLEGLSPWGVREYVDKSGSVSALVEVEDDCGLEQINLFDRREILNG